LAYLVHALLMIGLKMMSEVLEGSVI